ncbi:O-succinylhomoserine sulfhydrylase [Pseudoduganella namucuonensis]|uniref:O-succinylhomoserine sulfhydrylase n=1 Tax=Pseudoduganella namucuonensis TaxID=1035707 RepID=A0A1I7LCB9_9BURK|nr:O-succinylhomoserine sulfhydrylase [Pseudoduganella namucuonensis]SFV07361.1 O-succinylhomoserine sulfhydrylase [Pseudoduganella namucuonensis]
MTLNYKAQNQFPRHLQQVRPPQPLQASTKAVHGGATRSQFSELSEALFLTQSYVYESAEAAESRFNSKNPGYVYSRISNPTTKMFEDRIALLEGAESARATATGMASVTAALMGQVRAGDHIVSAKTLFGSCRYVLEDLLPRFGVEVTFVDGGDLGQWRKAFRQNTKTCFLESPANPTLEIYDIAEIASICHEHGATLVVDNAFVSPILQSPLELGADCVVYSATKHIDGQGRCLGGVILSSEEFMRKHVHDFLRHTGPSISPFNSWLLLKGLETLPLRVNAQQASALQISNFLSDQEMVTRVIYPNHKDHPQYELVQKQMKGGGTVVCFEVSGGKSSAFRFANALSIIKISNNFGDAKSIITLPSITTHQRLSPELRAEMGIPDGLLRLSVGLEDVNDLINDLRNALRALS